MSKSEAAFPHSDGAFGGTHHGMSLRDWFAGQVVATTFGPTVLAAELKGVDHKFAYQTMATMAYKVADAMIAARGQS